MSWLQPRLKHLSKGRVFFLFAGLVLTVLLAAFLVEEASRGAKQSMNASFSEIRPDLAKLLPSSAKWTDASVIAIESLAASDIPSYVAGYADGGKLHVALLAWDAHEGAFTLAQTAEWDAAADAAATLTAEAAPLGTGLPTMVVLQQRRGSASTDVIVLVADEAGLRVAQLAGENRKGTAAPASFVAPVRKDGGDIVLFQDVSGDGVADLLLRTAKADDVQVYEWQKDAFAYSERLSWAMVMSKQLFPEPPQAKAATIDDKGTAE
jgi:hypothetical protein